MNSITRALLLAALALSACDGGGDADNGHEIAEGVLPAVREGESPGCVPGVKAFVEGTFFDLAFVNNIMYAAQGENGLGIYDMADPVTPKLLGRVDQLKQAWGIEVQFPLVYVANGEAGLQIVDVSESENPQVIGSFDTNGQAFDVAVSGSLAYIADHENGIVILDISNPAQPSFIYDSSRRFAFNYNIAIEGSLVFTTHSQDGLAIFDATDPTNLFLAGHLPTSYNVSNVFIDGSILYVCDHSRGLKIYDMSHLDNLEYIGGYPWYIRYDGPGTGFRSAYSDSANDVVVQNGLAYVAGDVLIVLDVSDLSDPVLEVEVDVLSESNGGIEIYGHYAYLSRARQGLAIVGGLPGLCEPARSNR